MESITHGIERKYADWLHARMRELLKELENPSTVELVTPKKDVEKPIVCSDQDNLAQCKFSCEIEV